MRIAVGIGRPQSRDPDVVAAYVLDHFQPFEKEKIIKEVVPVIPEIINGLVNIKHSA